MSDTWKKSILVAFTYMGTVIGAGFASGQEIVRFFTLFGPNSIGGIILAALLFAILGTIILLLGLRLRANSSAEVLGMLIGQQLVRPVSLVMVLMLFGITGVLLAGAGQTLHSLLGLPTALGSLLTAGFIFIVLLYRISGIVAVNVAVVPLLIIFCLLISFGGIALDSNVTVDSTSGGLVPRSWVLSAFLYVAYNLVLSIGILAPLGHSIGNAPALVRGGVAGGLALGILAALINIAIARHPALLTTDLPILELARHLAPRAGPLYALILWAEIFTTLISNVYAATAWLGGKNQRRYLLVNAAFLLLAVLISFLGFSKLLGVLYPLFGYLCLILLGLLLIAPFRQLPPP